MRDTSTDFETGWLRNGLYEREYCDPASAEGLGGFYGLGELGQAARQLPPLGQQYLKQALADPTTRDDAKKLLREGGDALSDQAQKDTVEFMHPTGKHKIVFKGFARQMGQRGLAAEEAMINAMPYKDTEEGHDALELARAADYPEKALASYFTAIALDAMAPEEDLFGEDSAGLFGDDDEDEALDRLEPYGMGMSKKGKKILKTTAIVAAVAVGAVLTGGALLAVAPAILPALGSALPAVLGAVGSVAGAVFKPKAGGGAAQEQVVQEQPDINVVQQSSGGGAAQPLAPITAVEGSIFPPQVQQQLAQLPPAQAYQQAYQQAIQAGAGDEQAQAAAQQTQEQSEVAHGVRPAQAGMFGMDMGTMALIGVALFAVSQMGGGRKRNPCCSYNPRGKRRRPGKWDCKACGRRFKGPNTAHAHMERHHPSVYLATTGSWSRYSR